MILRFRIQGQDEVEISLQKEEGGFVRIAEYQFAKDRAHLLLQTAEEGMQHAGVQLHQLVGVVIQWNSEARFTVSRLAGTIANSLAWGLQIPVIAVDEEMGEDEIVVRLQEARELPPQIVPIEYSGEPTITL